jgi:cyclophilin family peptidyl-prolyl cis-trans isomerase
MRKLLIILILFCISGGLSLAEAKEKGKLTAIIETEYGKIEAELLSDAAPLTVANFIAQARTGAFDGTTFHRIIPGFVIQGGDPLSKDDDPANDGCGGGQMPAEPRKLSNERGTISMASSSRAKPIDSQSDVQFFINQGNNAALDGYGFIPFAKVTKGMDAVDKIVQQPRDGADRPLKNITMKVKVVISNK